MNNFIQKNAIAIDYKYLSRGLVSIGSNHILGLLIAVSSSFFFANYVEKDIFGYYQFVLTILASLSIFTLRGVGKQIVRSYVKFTEDTLVAKTFQFFLYSLPVAFLGLSFPAYFYFQGSFNLAFALLIGIFAFPFIGSLGLYGTVYTAREKFKKLAVLGTIQNLLPVLSLIAVILFHPTLLTLISTYCFAQVVTLVCLYLYTAKSEDLEFSTTFKKGDGEVHLSITESILDLGKMADRLIIFSMLGTVSLAVYTMALVPVREMLRLPQMLRMLILPKFSGHNLKQVRAKVFQKTLILFVALSVLSGIYILLSAPLFKILFPTYIESIFYTQLIALVIPFSANIFMHEMFTVFDKTKELYVINTVFSIVTILSLLTLTPIFGITGVVIGKFISTAVRFAMMSYFALRVQ